MMRDFRWQDYDVRWLAVAASAFLSVYTLVWPQLPNDDAYTYIRTADIFLNEGIMAALDHYSWAGYSIAIGLFSQLGFSLFTAAYLLNALFHALLVYSFVSVVKTIDDSISVVWMAALIVLVFPELNEYRYMIIRDTGFWALLTLGLWQFLLYFRGRKLRHGISFVLAVSLALIFRAEAMLYLLLTPICLLFDRRQDISRNLRDFLILTGVMVGSGSVVVFTLRLVGIDVIALLMEFVSVYQPFLINAINPSEADSIAAARVVFGDYAAAFSRQYLTAVIATGLLVVLFMNIFYAISGPYFWLLAYGWFRRHLRLDDQQLLPIWAWLIINTLILFVFLFVTRYLSSRYGMVLALMLAVQLPFVVSAILGRVMGRSGTRVGIVFLGLFFLYCVIDSTISFGKPRDWLLETAIYLNRETEPNSHVLTNNHTIAYFSGKVAAYDEVERMLTREQVLATIPGDLIAIELFYEMTELVADPVLSPYLEPLATFPVDTPRAAVYRRIDPP
ncbi:MAG: hypothetical protein OXD01_05655 [Gammaproteobacteria bacterium]|nr:hypothetical protein [Gammaproteobacteria bacterium]